MHHQRYTLTTTKLIADLPNIGVDALKPFSQLFVFLRIIPESIEGVHDDIHAQPVRETLQDGPNLVNSLLQRSVLFPSLTSRRQSFGKRKCLRDHGHALLAFATHLTSVLSIFLDEGEEPAQRLLIVVVFLALDDDLYAWVNNWLMDGPMHKPSSRGR
jgi:hypothetical protein